MRRRQLSALLLLRVRAPARGVLLDEMKWGVRPRGRVWHGRRRRRTPPPSGRAVSTASVARRGSRCRRWWRRDREHFLLIGEKDFLLVAEVAKNGRGRLGGAQRCRTRRRRSRAQNSSWAAWMMRCRRLAPLALTEGRGGVLTISIRLQLASQNEPVPYD